MRKEDPHADGVEACARTRRCGTGGDWDLGLPAPWPQVVLPLDSGDIPGALPDLSPVRQKAVRAQAE